MNTRPSLVLGVAVLGLGMIVATATARNAAVRTCHGMRVTISASKGEVHGTPRRDVIALTGAGHVEAGAGNDIICGSSKADVIEAGPGADVVVGRAGADKLDGGPGADRLVGDRGNDHLVGGDGPDYLMGGAGRNTIVRGDDRSHRRHQQQLGDTVVPGITSISFSIDISALQNLMNTGNAVGVAWNAPDMAGQMMFPVAWTMLRAPLRTNTIVLDRPLMGYVDTATAYPAPDMAIQPTFLAPVQLGQAYNVSPDVASAFMEAGPTIPQQVLVINSGSQAATVGLARQAWVNGPGAVSPVSVASLYPQSAVTMPPPTQAVLFISGIGMVQPGQLLWPMPDINAPVTPLPGSDTATVSLHYSNGVYGVTQDS